MVRILLSNVGQCAVVTDQMAPRPTDLCDGSALALHSKRRTSSHHCLWLIAPILLANVIFVDACSSFVNEATNVSLAQLATDEGAYNGREVVTEGIVRQFQDPNGTVYDVVEDGHPNRVELEPAGAADAYVGQQVDVLGTFHFDDRGGRSISVERVSVVGA